LDNLRTLQVALWDVSFATAFGTIVSGSFLIGFVKDLGGSDLWIGLVAAIPSLLGLLQIPGAVVGRSFSSFKRFVAPGGWVWRMLYLPLVALPLLTWDKGVRLQLLTVCIAFATAAVQFVSPIYNEWIANLVPPSGRGTYFARRTAVSTVVAMVVAFGAGIFFDRFRSAGQAEHGFSVLFGIGWVCSLVSMGFFLAMKDSVRDAPARIGLGESLRQFRAPIADPNFKRVLVYVTVFGIGTMLAGGLFIAFAIESLELSFTVIQLTQVAHALGTLATSAAWGYMTDRFGNKPVLTILTVGTVLTPLAWIFCVPGQTAFNTAILVIGHVYNGAVWSGVGVAQMNLWLATSPEKERANYLGTATAVQALASGVAPLIGAWLMLVLRPGFGAEWSYKSLFISVMAIRFASVFSLLPVLEPGAESIRRTLRRLVEVRPKGLIALRAYRASTDPESRARAVADVGSSRLSLGGSELVAALSDPVPTVRREAARSLAKLRDELTVGEIARFAEENPSTVEEEVLDALGSGGGPEAVRVLCGFLTDPRAALRRRAALVLGEIGDPAAALPLRKAALSDDPDLASSAIHALQAIGDQAAEEVIVRGLAHHAPIVRSAAAESAAHLGSPSLAEPLQSALAESDGAVLGEIAYALAVVAGKDAAEVVMRAAVRADTPMARRRCLLGLARIFDVEAPLYRLLAMEGMARTSELNRLLSRADAPTKKALRLVFEGQAKKAIESLAQRPGLESLKGAPDVDELALVALLASGLRSPGSLDEPSSAP